MLRLFDAGPECGVSQERETLHWAETYRSLLSPGLVDKHKAHKVNFTVCCRFWSNSLLLKGCPSEPFVLSGMKLSVKG